MADNIDFALNDHFYDFVDDWNYKFYFLVGGYGSSKSYHVAVKLIKKLLEEKRKALLASRYLNSVSKGSNALELNVVLMANLDKPVADRKEFHVPQYIVDALTWLLS